MITTQLSQPKAMDLIVPTKGNETELENSKALTVIILDKEIAFYEGQWSTALDENRIQMISFPFQLRKVIQARQEKLDQFSKTEGRKGLMVIVKPSKGSDYKTLVNVFDEILITDVRKYALTDLLDHEKEWVEKKK